MNYNLDPIEERAYSLVLYNGYKFIGKNKSLFMKFLSKILFFNKEFMTRYVTVIGNKVYVPENWQQSSTQLQRIMTLSHELQHISDKNKYGTFLFSLTYLMPQIFVLFAVLAIFNLWFLLFLLFLLPLPSPRAIWEWRGYKIDIMILSMVFNKPIEKNQGMYYIVDFFTSAAYYFMFPFKKFLRKKLEETYFDPRKAVSTTTQNCIVSLFASHEISK